ncbi:MAG: hypothetical protein LBC30_01780 [Puniceicoccales bacterium]|jgi:hypothetical protein|nr:hypothetical protein [Puniceicoccales bacterium]
MVSVKAKVRRKFTNRLPIGAKLDYKEDVDKLHANVMERVTASQKKAEEALAQNAKLAKQIRDVLAKQKKVLDILEFKPGEGNPVVKRFKDKLSGIDDIAKLAREHEMGICDVLGLTPKDGWERAFARFEKSAKKGGTMGELSDILLRKDKSEQSSDADYAEQKQFAEGVEGGSGTSAENGKTPRSTKRAIKKVKI